MKNLKLLDLLSENDYYIENEKVIYTAYFLAKCGHCCESNCRHCPYKKTEQEKKMSLSEKVSAMLSERKNPKVIIDRLNKKVKDAVDSALADLAVNPNDDSEKKIIKETAHFIKTVMKEFEKIK